MRYFFILITCLLTPYLSGADTSPTDAFPSLQELAMEIVIKQLNSFALEQLNPQSDEDTQAVINRKYENTPDSLEIVERCAKKTLRWPAKELSGLQGPVTSITFEENSLTARDSHKNAYTWNLDNFSLISTAKLPNNPSRAENYIQSSAENSQYSVERDFEKSPNGYHRFATLKVCDKKSDQPIASHSFQSRNDPTVLNLTEDNQLFIGTEKGNVLHWNFTDPNAQPKRISRGPGNRKHTKQIYDILHTPRKKHVYSTSKDNTVRYGPIAPGSSPVKIASHSNVNPYKSTISVDGTAAAGGWDNAVNLYEKGEIIQTVHTGEFTNHLAFSHDGTYLAIGRDSGKITVLKNPTQLVKESLKTLAAIIIQQNIDEKEDQATPNTKKRFRTVAASINPSLPTIIQEKETEEQKSYASHASKRRKLDFDKEL